MARFLSTLEAQEELNKANENISGLLKEDLKDITHGSQTIDIWLTRFGKDNNFKEKKATLIDYEMLKTDAELFIEFESNDN